jgi:Domain of unknown function (DUF4424)
MTRSRITMLTQCNGSRRHSFGRLRTATALVVAACAAAPALANDTSAELATGGLIFVQNDNVEMRSEDLAISAKEIAVRYRFFNKAASDVTVLVAFPMPDVRIEEPDQNISLPTEDPVNLLAFTTAVNGKPVKTQVEQHVFAAGIDRTQLLMSLGIPLAPHLKATNDALDRLAREKWDDLIRIGLAEIEVYDVGKGRAKHLSARWSLRTTFYWEQTFPAKAETLIEHRYRPSVGGSVQTSLGSPSAVKEAWYDDYKRKYCLDNDFFATIERLRKAAKSEFGPPYSEQRIDYILRTGANWSGPIGQFHLTVDKGEAGSLVSFCGPGVKKTGDTKFEMTKTDFSPEGDLAVLILKKMSK